MSKINSCAWNDILKICSVEEVWCALRHMKIHKNKGKNARAVIVTPSYHFYLIMIAFDSINHCAMKQFSDQKKNWRRNNEGNNYWSKNSNKNNIIYIYIYIYIYKLIYWRSSRTVIHTCTNSLNSNRTKPYQSYWIALRSSFIIILMDKSQTHSY